MWPESTGPELPAWASDPKCHRPDTPNFFLTKGCPLAHPPNRQEEEIGRPLGCASLSTPVSDEDHPAEPLPVGRPWG